MLRKDEFPNVGDVVAIHGIVREVPTPELAKLGLSCCLVELPDIPPLYFKPEQIAGIVTRRLERGDLVRVKGNSRHAGKTGKILATDETFAFINTLGEEPYGVLLTDVEVIVRAGERQVNVNPLHRL